MILLKRSLIELFTAVFILFIFSYLAVAGDAVIGKEKAAMCMGCHGPDGISVSPEVPNLAGQKKTYLINTIKDFRAEVRKNPIMNSMAKTLSDADIENLTTYFSNLK